MVALSLLHLWLWIVPCAQGLTLSQHVPAGHGKVSSHPHFRFGVIADVQYANVPDALNFQGTKYRRYKQSLDIFEEAVSTWNTMALNDRNTPMFSVVLGDIVDGKSRDSEEGGCLSHFREILASAQNPCYFTFGNHCHYSMGRSEIYELFCPKLNASSNNINGLTNSVVGKGGSCSPSKIYYDWSPAPGWRFISLDAYDVSLIGASSEHNRKQAKELLDRNNPNDLSVSGSWFNDLPREKHRWVPYNGGVSDEQLRWLERILTHSKHNNEQVVIICHQPIVSYSNPKALLWNAEELQQIIWSAGNVKLWLAGHDHGGQYSKDDYGVHHLIPPAPIECEHGQTAFGHIEVFDDRFSLHWNGKIPNRLSPLGWPADMAINKLP